MVRLAPRETNFVVMFAELAQTLLAGARMLHATLRDPENLETKVQQLKALEHKGDETTHAIFMRLNKTFITPFDREDIHHLASTLDDVLDFVYSAGERLVIYNIAAPAGSAVDLCDVIVRQAQQIVDAIDNLEDYDQVLRHCVELNRLENEADRIARAAIGALFSDHSDPISLIKTKELYEVLEIATDKAEDVANVLETIVLKSA